MQIEIPLVEQEKLSQQAAAAGYDDVAQYVTEQILALAHNSLGLASDSLNSEDLKSSLDVIDRGMEQIAAGEGLSISEARRRTLKKLGIGNG